MEINGTHGASLPGCGPLPAPRLDLEPTTLIWALLIGWGTMVNRTQALVLGFSLLAVLSLVGILVAAAGSVQRVAAGAVPREGLPAMLQLGVVQPPGRPPS
jgi:hypothetical protein